MVGSAVVPVPTWPEVAEINDVPLEAHAVLRRRAVAAHQSLQEYLRARLIEEAGQPTLEEVLWIAPQAARTAPCR